uniref:Protein kinase domain-containing protein n=1 Tax=Caenorhabditis japonica TaxID=281687 RepID=A0A8R1E2V9_CAEJA
MREHGRRTVRSDPPTYSILEDNVEEESEAEETSDTEKPPEHVPARFVPTQKSDDGGYPSHHHHDQFNRTVSAVSLPVGKQLRDMTEKSMYQKAIDQLNNDPQVHKEVGHEKVAVKIMDKAKMDQKAQKLLTREIQSMEKMNHPNIVKLFECVETLTRVHLVIEYASGGELYAFVHERGKLTELETKPLFTQIVSAVSHMHSRNLVHRDIKAENVMFSSPTTVKLVDFGFSCWVDRGQLLETFCGSPPYAAPELFRDKSYAGEQVDIWALGILLYFMMVGVTPFKGETVSDMKQIIMQATPTFPEYIGENPKKLIRDMLRANADERPGIDLVKKNVWLGGKFVRSYISIKTDFLEKAEKEEKEKIAIDEKVWKIMNNLGILREMLVEDCIDKGPRDAIIGTYRIVQFQVQQEMAKLSKEKEEPSESSQNGKGPEIDLTAKRKLKTRSKTCTII